MDYSQPKSSNSQRYFEFFSEPSSLLNQNIETFPQTNLSVPATELINAQKRRSVALSAYSQKRLEFESVPPNFADGLKNPEICAEAQSQNPKTESAPFFTNGAGYFGFMRLPTRPQLLPEERSAIMSGMVSEFNLKDLNLETFGLRPAQHILAEHLLNHTDSSTAVLVQAGTGSGKTGLFMLKALAEKARGFRSILVVPLVNLATQSKDMLENFTIPGSVTVEVCTGRTSRLTRPALYSKKPDILIISEGVLINDFEKIDWSNVGLVAFDEPQLSQRRDGSLPSNEKVRDKKPGVLRIFMSATLASSEDKLVLMRRSLGLHSFLNLVTPREITRNLAELPCTLNTTQVFRHTWELPIHHALKPITHSLRSEVVRCVDGMGPDRERLRLFDVPQSPSVWIPSFLERDRLARKAESNAQSEDRPMIRSLWSESNKWATLFNRAALLGRFSFLEHYCYRFAKQEIQGGLYLKEIEGKTPKKERGQFTLADKRILGREPVTEEVKKLAINSPYEELLKGGSWDEILERCERFFDELDTHPLNSCTAQRLAQMAIANKRLGSPNGNTEKARLFFDEALRYVAHCELSDSQKLIATSELLERHLEALLEGRSFIFTTSTRHADFLAEAIAHRYSASGMTPIALHGRTPRKVQEEGMKMLRSGERNILITTMAYAGTGLDLPDARMAIAYSISDSMPTTLTQAIGRVVGRANKDAYIYFLASQGSMEAQWYQKALSRNLKLKQAVSSRAASIIPEFEV